MKVAVNFVSDALSRNIHSGGGCPLRGGAAHLVVTVRSEPMATPIGFFG